MIQTLYRRPLYLLMLVAALAGALLLSACTQQEGSTIPTVPPGGQEQEVGAQPWTPGETMARTRTMVRTDMRTAMTPAGPPNFAHYGFTEVLASQEVQPGTESMVSGGAYSVKIPGDAFSNPVRFEILQAPLDKVSANAPQGETPILDYAFRVTDMNTNNLVGEFNNPVMVSITSPEITDNSKYYNFTTSGEYELNMTGAEVMSGALTHHINNAMVAWVITK